MDAEAVNISRKRKFNHGKSNKKRKKMNSVPSDSLKSKKPSKKMAKLFKKRAEAYNSDEEEIEEDELDLNQEDYNEEEKELGLDDSNEEESQGYGHRQGVMKFTEGCRAFKMAFISIMKKSLMNDPLGPVLSAHKKLVAGKLAEEGSEQKAKGEIKKEKHMAAEKGHVKPEGFLDAKEKLLISVATKGVVKLFNAVNKAQNTQKGLNTTKSKDAKALAKQRKNTFLSELKKSTTISTFNSSKVSSFNKTNYEEPGWAPLRDDYMLTSSRLKDWDKLEESASIGGHTNMPSDESSSDDD